MFKNQRGFTIVELMIAMVTSLILLGGVLKVYTSSKQSYNMTENLSRLQEGARFSTDLLVREIRMAGFLPCRLAGVNTMNTVTGAPAFLDFFGAAVNGFDGTNTAAADFTAAGFPAVGTAAGNRIAGSDAIIMMGGGDKNYKIDDQPAVSSADIKATGDGDFVAGDILLVCNDKQATLFQVTNENYQAGTDRTNIVHNTGVGTPGNCTKTLFSATQGCDCGDLTCLDTVEKFEDDANLVELQSHGYFIGAGSDTSVANPTFSLYRVTLQNTGVNQTFDNIQELVPDIESMQLLYGVDPDDDNQVERYVTADFVGGAGEPTWNQVLSVRLGILARTPDVVSTANDATTYNVAGTAIGTATTVSHAADKRLRHAFNSTVKIRNRGL